MECPICFYNWNKERTIPLILFCGHSICMACSLNLFSNNKINCPTCSMETIFSIEKSASMSQEDFKVRCIDSLTKNFTLLALLPAKSSKIQATREFKYGMKCKDHNLLIHSYVSKPFSMLCDTCIEEITGMNLKILPFPEVLNVCEEKLKEFKKNIQKMKLNLEVSDDDNISNVTNEFEEYFTGIQKKINEASLLAVGKLREKVRIFKEDAKLQYRKCEEILSKIKINEQRAVYLSTLSLGDLISEKKTIDRLFMVSKEQSFEISLPTFTVDLQLKDDSLNVLRSYIKNSVSLKLKAIRKETWTCKTCQKCVKEGLIRCDCGSFRPLETYPNIISNPYACTASEISEMQQRRDFEMNLINELDNNSEENQAWYIINADWVSDWKSFVFNRPTRAVTNLPEIGILPPGPINNKSLLKENGEPKLKLKPAVHYRGVNEKVWFAYMFMYGGGPSIVRKTINIYE